MPRPVSVQQETVGGDTPRRTAEEDGKEMGLTGEFMSLAYESRGLCRSRSRPPAEEQLATNRPESVP